MDRRTLLAAGVAAAALPGTAPAQPAAPATTPRFHRMMVGAVPVTVLHDGVVRRADATQGFIPNASPEAVSGALAAAGTPGPALENPYNQTVVQTPAGLVLIDVGNGVGGPPGTGQMPAAMRAAGLDPANVAVVVISHFHGDHINGLTAPDGTPAFPNAAIKVPEREWTFWHDEGEEARSTEFRRPGFANARRRFAPYAARVERFAPGAEVAPGITALGTPGHSPGHTSFRVADGNAQLIIVSDAVTTPSLFLPHPDWYPIFDMDPPLAVETRKRLLDQVATDRVPVIGYHFPFPATGQVERAGSAYRLVPTA